MSEISSKMSLLLNHKALGVLLSHPCISGSQVLLASLLMTCKALNDAIAEELLGTVPIRHCILSASNLSNTAGLADWIAARGHILSGITASYTSARCFTAGQSGRTWIFLQHADAGLRSCVHNA